MGTTIFNSIIRQNDLRVSHVLRDLGITIFQTLRWYNRKIHNLYTFAMRAYTL